MHYAFTVPIYARGTGGVPSTSVLLAELGSEIESLSFTITDSFGFESAEVTLTASVDEALAMFDWLMASTVIYGPDGETCWEGYLASVEATLGQEKHSRSLDGMANRVRVAYTTPNGVAATTSPTSDTTSQFLYGVKDAVVPLDTAATADANNRASAVLAVTRWPVRTPSSEIATGDMGQVSVSLKFAGWYDTLGWVVTTRGDTTQESTTTQVGDLIQASGVGIGVTNAFLSTSRTRIAASGITATRQINANTTYRQKIEDLLGQGNQVWGVLEGRQFVVDTWAGSSPTTITYTRSIADGALYTLGGALVAPWNARPNAMYQIEELLDLSARSNEPDAAGRYYVARTSFRMGGDSFGVTLEPAAPDDLGGVLTRLQRGR